jgi:hypothetical protein
VDQVDASHHLEQFARHMARAAIAARTHIDLARIGLRVRDELREGLGRDRRVDFDDVGHAHDACYGRNVADEIVVELFVKRCVDRIGQ